MPFRDRFILRAAAAWTVFVWAVFVKNIVGDSHHSTGFKVVHVVLAIVSIAFAFAIWTVASRNRSRERQASRD
jgi:Na+/melibiose symporter-like transporter